MIANTKHIKDYSFIHHYLCGDDQSGQKLYASIFPVVKGFIFSYNNAKNLTEANKEEIFSNTLKTSIEKLEYYNGTS